MAVFEYKALNSRGRQIRGVIDAESIRSARSRLKQQGVFPTHLIETRVQESAPTARLRAGFLGPRRVNVQQLSMVTRQLSTLVGAGIPLVEAIKALVDQLDLPRLKRVFAEVADRVNEGATLADAMRLHPKVFPRLFVNLVASGEASGTLDVVLDRLADLLESQADLRRKIVSASVYPALMLALCIVVIILLLAFVIPQITAIFEERQATLPVPTRIVIMLSDFVSAYWLWMLVGLGVLIEGFRRYARSERGRARVDALQLKLPIWGSISTKVAAARFSRTLGTMLASGIELLSALSIVKNIIGNVVLEQAVENAAVGVREGRALAPELARSQVFPKLLTHMISVGERTGQLEQMLLRAASSYESEVNAVVSSLTKILEPILILFIACVVGGIMFSVMLPMLEMSSFAG